jgi:transcriptional regulator with XRE-family HTH domain
MFAVQMTVNENIYKVLGDNVRKLREGKGWTQKDLAFEIDMEPAYISKIELGKTNPSLKKISLLAKALDTSPADLLKQ